VSGGRVKRGPVAWMAQNAVAANLAMLVLILGGLKTASVVKQEVFPEFDLDMIMIGVPYPGASPAEVEQGIVLAIEEEIRSLDGVKKVTSSAVEGAAGITVELELGTNANKALADAKAAVDRITSLPEDAEEPTVSLASNRRQVIQLVLFGDQSEETMRQLAERARSELLLLPSITYVELTGVREREIAVEVPQDNLRAYNLTLAQIADTIDRLAVELPGGGVKTHQGEILVRTAERRDLGREFAELRIINAQGGTGVRLGDIATITDGFVDNDQTATFNGKRAVMVNVYRSGTQTPIDISDAVHAYVDTAKSWLPAGVGATTLNDSAQMYRERVDLLLRNARMGLILVLLVLGLFLNLRLAFWVTMGIPISFLGSLMLMPVMDVSINMISLFAFIITLGIVVDDAIVVGENIHELRTKGASLKDAAVVGVKQVAMPVVFSVLTTVAAFMPLFLVPGTSGKFFRNIPAIVISVLMVSLLESLFVLPAHLGHRSQFFGVLGRFFASPFSARIRAKPLATGESEEELDGHHLRLVDLLETPGRHFSRWLHTFTENRYAPFLAHALGNRALTLSVGVALLALTVGVVASGRLEWTFMPKVDGDVITARAVLPFGVPVQDSERVRDRLLKSAHAILAEHGGEKITLGAFAQVGADVAQGFGPAAGPSAQTGSHLATVQIFLVPTDQRDITASEFARVWRERFGPQGALESLTFQFATGPGATASLEVQLAHSDLEVLERAAGEVAGKLGEYSGVKDISDGFSDGKPQLNFHLTPEGRSLGLTAAELGRQVRAAFFGAEALRQQRGRDEVRVMVRLPERERRSEHDIGALMIRTPDGGDVPLGVAATVERGVSYTTIKRADGRRVVTVTGDTVAGEANPTKILGDLKQDYLPELVAHHPGLSFSFEGDRRRSDESMAALGVGYILALIIIYALLAIPFRSYVQPLVVMASIPFGIVGAVLGHLVMGYDMSLISVMGIVAVSGIVVNDSLVLVHAANEARDAGYRPIQAIQLAARRRLRPIMLTSLTTFFGLMPMILEPSVQARFLIPMAVALGFGVLFSTFIVLLIVPSLYLLVEDARAAVLGERARAKPAAPAAPPVTAP
jgi:multidrug efflux pump subunit AcrB